MGCPKCGCALPDDSVFCPYCGCNVEEVRAQNNECRKCGKRLPEDSSFCPYCGTQVGPNNKKTVKISKKTKKVIIAAVLTLVVITSILALPALMSRIKYSQANKLLESGQYAAAYAAFEALGSYEDAETMLVETRYLEAIALQAAGDYDQANEILETIEWYKDSKSLYHDQHDYRWITITPATCKEDGVLKTECKVCGYSYESPIAATGHGLDSFIYTDKETGKSTILCKYCA